MPLQPFPGFCGPSYQDDNKYATIERTVNWYCQPNEARREEIKGDIMLAPSPGNAPFGQLPVPNGFNQPNRGLLEYRGRLYGVNGTIVFWMDAGGKYNAIGAPIASDNGPVSMKANANQQIGIASAGQLYVIDTGANTLTGPIKGGFLGALQLAFQDNYLIAAVPGTNQFQISGTDNFPTGDMTLWQADNVAELTGQADVLNAIGSSREYLRLFGQRRTQVFINVGANGQGGFPFQSYNSTFIESGSLATWGVVDMGPSWIWICQDERGFHSCWEDPAFQPRRISTFAVEQAWGKYGNTNEAVAFPYIWKGHLIYRVTFPGYGTWEYDKTVSELLQRPIWTERNFTDWQGNQHERPELFHAFCYQLNLVGSNGLDGNPGAIYAMDGTAFYDCAMNGAGAQIQTEIVRDRICPHLWNGNNRVIYDEIDIELAKGVGLDGAPPVGVNPQLLLKWSDDGGNTWGPWFQIPVGRIGAYNTVARLYRLGYGRDRVFWIRCSDPVYWGLVNASLALRPCAS